jgi:hypothetical protein
VREYQSTRRQRAKLSVPGLEDIFAPLPPATSADVLEALSEETLQRVLAARPVDERFTLWRAKVRKILAGRVTLNDVLVLPAQQTV